MIFLDKPSRFFHPSCIGLLIVGFLFSAECVSAETQEVNTYENEVQVTTAPSVNSDLHTDGAIHERNIGIFAGSAQLSDTRITMTYQCLICSLTSGSQDFQFGQGSISGIRAELWGKYFGAAFELSSTSNIPSRDKANGASAIIGLNSVSIIPMLRIPFFATDSMPNGKLNLYGGLGLDAISWMSMEISMPGQTPLSVHRSGGSNTASPGILIVAGASWNFSHWIVFTEFRSLDTRIDYDGAVNNFGLAPVRTVSIPIHMSQTIAGIKYRF